MNINALKIQFIFYFNRLKNFHFSIFNPLFWIFLLVLFLILLRYWGTKKSFSFSLVIGIVLLATTKAEIFVINMISSYGKAGDPFLIRVFSFIIISVVTFYYTFIKTDY